LQLLNYTATVAIYMYGSRPFENQWIEQNILVKETQNHINAIHLYISVTNPGTYPLLLHTSELEHNVQAHVPVPLG